MARAESKDAVVGFELAGDRIRIAAILVTDSASRSERVRRLRYDEIVLPNGEACAPGTLPPTSELVPLIKAAMARLGITRGQAALALGGQRMVLRYFIGAHDPVRAELQQAIARSMDYVHLGSGDRVIGEYTHQMPGGRAHALLGVGAADTTDPVTKALEQIGLRVRIIEPALVALTRVKSLSNLVAGKSVLLAHVDAEGTDIAVVSDGHVLFSRRPLPPPGADSGSAVSDRAERLPRELERVARHCARILGASEELRQVILCGPKNVVRAHAEALAGSTDFEAAVLSMNDAVSSKLGVPAEDVTASDSHAVALGVAAGLVNDGSSVVGPNLASEPDIQRRSPLQPLFRALFWPTLAAVGIWGGVCLFKDQLQTKLDKVRIEAEHPSPVEAEYLQLQIELSQIDQVTGRIERLTKKFQDRNWTGILETIRVCVRERLWLTSVQVTEEGRLTLKGTAFEESPIYQFREDLEGAPLFDRVTIIATSSTQRDRTLVTEFTLECTVIGNFVVRHDSGT